MKRLEDIKDVLSFYNVTCNEPYYISSGNKLASFPTITFRMDYYVVGICMEGSIELEIDNNFYTIQKNSLLLSAPSTIVRFIKASEDFRIKLLFFAKNFLLTNISNPFIIEKMSLFNSGSYSIIATTQESSAQLLSLLDYLKTKTSANICYKQEMIQTIIFNLLLEIANIVHKKSPSKKSLNTKKDIHLQFLQLVRLNVAQHQSVQYYAERLFISNKYLLEIVKKHTGKTPHKIIDETLVKEAIVLLNNPERTISDIAFALNFNSVAAFSRFFKKMTNESPSYFRNKN